nr:unnamed protein product [Spirometra erinaceieuropaei]
MAAGSQFKGIAGVIAFFGFFSGLGLGAVCICAMVSVTYYFEKYRGVASGIAAAGNGVGYILVPLVLSTLMEFMDWRKSVLVYALITASVFFSAAIILRPIEVDLPSPDEMADLEEKQSLLQFPVSNRSRQVSLAFADVGAALRMLEPIQETEVEAGLASETVPGDLPVPDVLTNADPEESTQKISDSLKPDSEWTVKSAEEFLTRIKHFEVEADEVMVSFDVISLFTSIPPALAIDTIDGFLREKFDETDQQLKRAHIIELLELCLKTFFTFNGQVYEQKKGTPMGSPLSGLIAEAVLQRLEQQVFSSYPPKFWARYVDDTFVVIKRSEVKAFKTLLNSIFPDIQFTVEEEVNNQLPFLDVQVTRLTDGKIRAMVYHPTKVQASSIDKVLKRLTGKKQLSEDIAKSLKQIEPTIAKIYGLPKVHKTEVPLRPIVSLIGAPNYKISKWLFQKLHPLTKNCETSIENSTEFLKKLQGITISSDEIMVSFDVVSLFTSIPLDVAKKCTEDLLLCYDTDVPAAAVLELIGLCLETNFSFDQQCYKQLKGAPMGSPISGFLAEITMQKL